MKFLVVLAAFVVAATASTTSPPKFDFSPRRRSTGVTSAAMTWLRAREEEFVQIFPRDAESLEAARTVARDAQDYVAGQQNAQARGLDDF